jgi:uncharacterized protein (DUF362 family)
MYSNNLLVIYGQKPLQMAYEIMSAANVKSMLSKDMKIALKPNLVVEKPHTSGATTSPEIVEGIVKYLKDNGYNNISIMESSGVGNSATRAYKVCGYDRISAMYNVPLIDLSNDRSKTLSYNRMSIKICAAPIESDFLINIPVLKAHCQTRLTCALKNLKGCIPDSEKRRFHTLGLHNPIVVLNKLLKSDLIVVDGIMGDLTFEEGGTPVEMNRIILGTDPVLIDAYAAQLLGYCIEDIPYILKAEEMGVGQGNVHNSLITELNRDHAPAGRIQANRRVKRLSKYIQEDQACSICYGSLIHALNRLDEKGLLNKLRQKICIGQGFKGREYEGIGVGNCTLGCSKCIKGCPPKATDIVKFLENSI